MIFDFSIEFDSESVHPDFEDVSTLLFYRAVLRKLGVAYHRANKEHKRIFREDYYPAYTKEMIRKFGLLPERLEDYHTKWYIKYYL